MSQSTTERDKAFHSLSLEVQACRACARMCDSARILGRSAGPLDAQAMFIGEAPGRLGADESEIPFHGDKSGHNFEQLLSQVGLSRYHVFVTNAVLCNPRDAKGNNSPPTRPEIEACSRYLKRQIDLVQPRVVVTLGATALFATSLIEEHMLSLRSHTRTACSWYGRILIPAYHPGQRAMVHRSFANQLADYQFIAEHIRRIGKKSRRKVSASIRIEIKDVVEAILRIRPTLSYFSLHKLFYLVESHCVDRLGRRLTDAYIIRQKDGPYCTDLHLAKLRKAFPELEVSRQNGTLILSRPHLSLFPTSNTLDVSAQEVLEEVVTKYGSYDDVRLKTAVYLTMPMRAMLRAERLHQLNTFNAPIDFGAQ